MTTLVFVLGLFWFSETQNAALEKKAVAIVQQISAAQLDSQLPDRSFSSWFNQVVGPQSGVNWQMTDCGEQPSASPHQRRDMPLCVEVVAIRPNQRKVVVNIQVGTMERGIVGTPKLYFAVVEYNAEFYTAARLSELPNLVLKPLKPKPRPSALPDVKLKKPQVVLSNTVRSVPGANVKAPSVTGEIEMPPPPGSARTAVLNVALGEVITKVTPEYPTTARQIGASGDVKVQILVSEEGRVLEAKAISGPVLLRGPAEIAAGKWIFKPAMLDGKPAKAKGTVIFTFRRYQ